MIGNSYGVSTNLMIKPENIIIDKYRIAYFFPNSIFDFKLDNFLSPFLS